MIAVVPSYNVAVGLLTTAEDVIDWAQVESKQGVVVVDQYYTVAEDGVGLAYADGSLVVSVKAPLTAVDAAAADAASVHKVQFDVGTTVDLELDCAVEEYQYIVGVYRNFDVVR